MVRQLCSCSSLSSSPEHAAFHTILCSQVHCLQPLVRRLQQQALLSSSSSSNSSKQSNNSEQNSSPHSPNHHHPTPHPNSARAPRSAAAWILPWKPTTHPTQTHPQTHKPATTQPPLHAAHARALPLPHAPQHPIHATHAHALPLPHGPPHHGASGPMGPPPRVPLRLASQAAKPNKSAHQSPRSHSSPQTRALHAMPHPLSLCTTPTTAPTCAFAASATRRGAETGQPAQCADKG